MTAVRHVVLFRLLETDVRLRDDQVSRMRERLEGLVGVVPGLSALTLRPDLGAAGHWDVALVSDHDSAQALADYQDHPAHREVVAWVSTLVAERAVVDFEA